MASRDRGARLPVGPLAGIALAGALVGLLGGALTVRAEAPAAAKESPKPVAPVATSTDSAAKPTSSTTGTASKSTGTTAAKPTASAAPTASSTPTASSAPSSKTSASEPGAKPVASGAPAAKKTVTDAAAKPMASGAPAAKPSAPATAAPPKTPVLKSPAKPSGVKAAPQPGRSRTSGPGVQVATAVEERTSYHYNTLGRRDPFESLVESFVGEDVGGSGPADIGGIRVVGIVWGTDPFALVEDGRGNSGILRRGDKVMNGFVEALQRDGVVVRLSIDGQSQTVTLPLIRKEENSNASR